MARHSQQIRPSGPAILLVTALSMALIGVAHLTQASEAGSAGAGSAAAPPFNAAEMAVLNEIGGEDPNASTAGIAADGSTRTHTTASSTARLKQLRSVLAENTKLKAEIEQRDQLIAQLQPAVLEEERRTKEAEAAIAKAAADEYAAKLALAKEATLKAEADAKRAQLDKEARTKEAENLRAAAAVAQLEADRSDNERRKAEAEAAQAQFRAAETENRAKIAASDQQTAEQEAKRLEAAKQLAVAEANIAHANMTAAIANAKSAEEQRELAESQLSKQQIELERARAEADKLKYQADLAEAQAKAAVEQRAAAEAEAAKWAAMKAAAEAEAISASSVAQEKVAAAISAEREQADAQRAAHLAASAAEAARTVERLNAEVSRIDLLTQKAVEERRMMEAQATKAAAEAHAAAAASEAALQRRLQAEAEARGDEAKAAAAASEAAKAQALAQVAQASAASAAEARLAAEAEAMRWSELRKIAEANVTRAAAEAAKASADAAAAQTALHAAQVTAQANAAALATADARRETAEAEARKAASEAASANATLSEWIERRRSAEAQAEAYRHAAEAADKEVQVAIQRRLAAEAEQGTERQKAAIAASSAEKAFYDMQIAESQLGLSQETVAAEQAKQATAKVFAANIAAERDNLELKAKLQLTSHESDLARLKAADELERQRHADAIAAEEASHVRREQARVAAEQALKNSSLSMEMELAVARAKAEAAGRIEQERANEDVSLRRLQAQAQADTEKLRQAILVAVSASQTALTQFLMSDQVWIALLALFGGALGVFLAREGVKMVIEEIRRHIGQPALIRESSLQSGFSRFFCGCCNRKKTLADPFSDVVLTDALALQLNRLALSTRNARANKAPLRHVLFYGPPGTGKTMVAQRLARHCGLDYAIMSGGDVAPLGPRAVTEMHRLFQWAKSTPRGLMLFIDEAEAFLGTRARGDVSEHLRNVLSAILYQTGTQSDKYMLILATNRPGDLDSAVTDRMDEALHFHPPGRDERRRLLWQYYNEFIASRSVQVLPPEPVTPARPAKPGKEEPAAAPAEVVAPLARRRSLNPFASAPPPSIQVIGIKMPDILQLADRLEGFSGRQIMKLMLNVQGAVYAEKSCTLTQAVLESVLKQELQKFRHQLPSTPTVPTVGAAAGGAAAAAAAAQ